MLKLGLITSPTMCLVLVESMIRAFASAIPSLFLLFKGQSYFNWLPKTNSLFFVFEPDCFVLQSFCLLLEHLLNPMSNLHSVVVK